MKCGIGTRHGKAGFALFFLLASASFALWAPNAGAQSGYYTSRGCSGCHGTAPTTCNGCHEHGVNGRTGSPQSATVNKTTFAPGENVIVTLRGGRTSSATNGTGGWVRGILYRNNVEIARSAGTVAPGNIGPSGGSGLPITFTTAAPTTPGTYTYAAAWFGNTGNNGSTHGEVRAPAITITVQAAAPSISTSSPLPAGTVKKPYSQTLAATGGTGTYSWSVSAGTLPAGLNLSAAGVLSGTPTAAGTFNFTFQVTGGGTATKPFSMTINPALVVIDFEPDGKTDLTVWRPSTGQWWVLRSSDGTFTSKQWGAAGDDPVPGDYDGDGKTDYAVWRPSTGVWFILQSSDGYNQNLYKASKWGNPTDLPVPGDYDGDGKTDYAVWRPSTGIWYISKASGGAMTPQTQWGNPTDLPVPGDYDGDGKTDYAVWRPSTGIWYILESSVGYDNGRYKAYKWGDPTDIPVPGDYDADGKMDIAVWRPSTGVWYILQSTDGYNESLARAYKKWGDPTDIPVPGSYDGDGKTDLAVYRPSTGVWYILLSTDGYNQNLYKAYKWGTPNDNPVN